MNSGKSPWAFTHNYRITNSSDNIMPAVPTVTRILQHSSTIAAAPSPGVWVVGQISDVPLKFHYGHQSFTAMPNIVHPTTWTEIRTHFFYDFQAKTHRYMNIVRSIVACLNPIPTSLKDCSEYPTADGAPQPVLPAESGHDGVHGQVAEPLLRWNGVWDDLVVEIYLQGFVVILGECCV